MVEMLVRTSVFDGLDLAMPPLVLEAQPPCHRFIARGAADELEAVLGRPLPREACRSVRGGGVDALWLGPDEWLLLADAPLAVPGLVDVSHRQAALVLSGTHAAAALNGGCPLDLDPAAFPLGACTRTLFGKAEIVLWRRVPEAFHLEIARSFVPYVIGVLREASYGVS